MRTSVSCKSFQGHIPCNIRLNSKNQHIHALETCSNVVLKPNDLKMTLLRQFAPCGQRRLLSSSGNCALASDGIVCSSDDLYELHLPLLSPIAGRNSNIVKGTFSVSVFDGRYITLKCPRHKRQLQISEKFFHYFVNGDANARQSCENTPEYELMVITSETISKRKARFYANLRIGRQYRKH